MPDVISNELKQQIIGEYMKTASGRAKLAASMVQPLRLRRDYTSVGRKTFLVEQLPDGALPIYDKDPNVSAFVVGEEGQNSANLTDHDMVRPGMIRVLQKIRQIEHTLCPAPAAHF